MWLDSVKCTYIQKMDIYSVITKHGARINQTKSVLYEFHVDVVVEECMYVIKIQHGVENSVGGFSII
jgi:hypothetical protein